MKVKIIAVKHFIVSVKRLLGQHTVPLLVFSSSAAERPAAGYQAISRCFVISPKTKQQRITFFLNIEGLEEVLKYSSGVLCLSFHILTF
jgi:hypothetical protein